MARGSYLLVENLDRISRQTARKALRTLEAIVEAGVTVVTLTDAKVYTEAGLDSDPVSLMMAILTFVRAHEESALKGRRVRAAWDNKRRKAAEDGTPLTRRVPGWMVPDAKGRLRLDRTKAATVRRIFKMTLAGVGQHSIARELNRTKVKPFNGGDRWHRSYVKKIIQNPAVIGRLVAHQVEWENGRKVRRPVVEIEDHFPAAVSKDDWTRVQEMRDLGQSTGRRSRAVPKSEAAVKNILAGIARCPSCDGTMTRVSKGPSGGYPYLVCAKAKAGAGCTYKSVRMEGVEAIILAHVGSLLGDIPSDDPTGDHLARLDDELAEARERAENVAEAIADHGMTDTLRRRLTTLEKIIADLEAQQAEIAAKVESAPLLAMKVEALRAELSSPKPDRARVNALLRQLVRAVVVDYAHGDLVFQWKPGGKASRLSYTVP